MRLGDDVELEYYRLQQVSSGVIGLGEEDTPAEANPFDKFSLGVRPKLEELMIERMADNDALVTRALNDPDFQEIVFGGLLQAIFDAAIAQKHQQATLDV